MEGRVAPFVALERRAGAEQRPGARRRADLGAAVQRRRALAVRGVGRRAGRQQHLDAGLGRRGAREVQRRAAPGVARVDGRAVAQQELDGLGRGRGGGEVERRLALLVDGVERAVGRARMSHDLWQRFERPLRLWWCALGQPKNLPC